MKAIKDAMKEFSENTKFVVWSDFHDKTLSEINGILDIPYSIAVAVSREPTPGESLASDRMMEIARRLASSMTYLSGGGIALIAALLNSNNDTIIAGHIKFAISCFVASLLFSLLGLTAGFFFQTSIFRRLNAVITHARTLEDFSNRVKTADPTFKITEKITIDFLVETTNKLIEAEKQMVAMASATLKAFPWSLLVLLANVSLIVMGAVLTLVALI